MTRRKFSELRDKMPPKAQKEVRDRANVIIQNERYRTAVGKEAMTAPVYHCPRCDKDVEPKLEFNVVDPAMYAPKDVCPFCGTEVERGE